MKILKKMIFFGIYNFFYLQEALGISPPSVKSFYCTVIDSIATPSMRLQ